MKNSIILILMMGISLGADAQLLERLGKKVERKVKQRIDRRTDQAIDKGLDKAEDLLEGDAGDQEPATAGNSDTGNEGLSDITGGAVENPFHIHSDYDFIAGENIFFFEDFEVDAIGDFPVRWNTNGSGEAVHLSTVPGKWLKVPDNTLSFPEIGKPMPENFTVEFDLFYPAGITRPPITFGFTDAKNPAKEAIRYKKLFYFRISPSVDEHIGYSTSLYSGRGTTKDWPANKMAGKSIRVSIAVNKQRIRLYMDQSKLFDLPRAFEPAALRNSFFFRAAEVIPAPQDGFYISNLRIAESGLDIRSQLLKDGVYSTTGIHFDSGSADIKPESAGILQEIAVILQENPDVRIQVVGHTDSDGSTEGNLSLSKNRAAAVKAALIQHYGIGSDRIETDGKGASDPVAPNDTAAGKAANRRVVFIKL